MYQKHWKIITKTYVVEFPGKKLLQLQQYSLQPTTGAKIALQIHSGVQNCSFFSNATTLQSRISECQRKKISEDVGKTAVKKILKILSGKGL